MTRIPILPQDTRAASRSQTLLEQRHGAPRALEMAAARIRADAAYLAKWIGPSAAAELVAAEAHRVVAEAAAEVAVPGCGTRSAGSRKGRRLLTLGRAAAWTIGILTGFTLGLGVSAWALG